MTPEPEPLRCRWPAPDPLDLPNTLGPLRHGRYDPTIRIAADAVWLARRTAEGPAALRMAVGAGELAAEAWGPGAEVLLARAPAIAGLRDDPSALIPHHPLVAELVRRFEGLRLPATGEILAPLVPAVIEQKITAPEAHATYLAILRRLGEPAPGPVRLTVPPAPEALAALPYFAYHPLGLERRRADLLRRLGRLGARLEDLAALPPDEARRHLQAVSGVGPWTAAEVTRVSHGDPDAVSLGDAHIPSMVSWALVREPRADDVRMLEILAPYPGQRARVVRLLEAAGITAPRFGPRVGPRSLRGL